jgi:hypothetical protein
MKSRVFDIASDARREVVIVSSKLVNNPVQLW